MTVNAEQFRQGMRRLGGAVNIVTSAHEGIYAGLTATAVTSLSAEPPRLLTCINRAGVTYETISKGRSLAINVLGTQHKDLAILFAGLSGQPETERFSSIEWNVGVGGAPLLPDALVSFDCEVESILDAGSHGIVIGLIRSIVVGGNSGDTPLCYLDGDWATMTNFS
ncbi:flavin reductase family protein [Kordiimonas pumila]|uniref:Flavin reductase family protein n=1 Tax=Kordiimonas pumila TaxID=2161677 RepID=A0ABV7D2L5_9PROT|nr:flavin reductase family protein [Kordiimonas pumila]